MDNKSDFETWWHNEGSAPPKPQCVHGMLLDECCNACADELNSPTARKRADLTHCDWEAHCKKMCEIAWKNGVYQSEQVEVVLNGEKVMVSTDELLKSWSMCGKPEKRVEIKDEQG